MNPFAPFVNRRMLLLRSTQLQFLISYSFRSLPLDQHDIIRDADTSVDNFCVDKRFPNLVQRAQCSSILDQESSEGSVILRVILRVSSRHLNVEGRRTELISRSIKRASESTQQPHRVSQILR